MTWVYDVGVGEGEDAGAVYRSTDVTSIISRIFLGLNSSTHLAPIMASSVPGFTIPLTGIRGTNNETLGSDMNFVGYSH